MSASPVVSWFNVATLLAAIAVPFQTPVPIVPTEVMLEPSAISPLVNNISSALAVIPLPPITFRVAAPLVSELPVKPVPATIEVISPSAPS